MPLNARQVPLLRTRSKHISVTKAVPRPVFESSTTGDNAGLERSASWELKEIKQGVEKRFR
jgi:hypothetical protein